jgi:hypothetical protein
MLGFVGLAVRSASGGPRFFVKKYGFVRVGGLAGFVMPRQDLPETE